MNNSVACAPPSPTQVEDELGSLSSTIEALDSLLLQLGDRISSVIREVPPEPCGKGVGMPSGALVPLANQMRDRRWRLESLCGRVDSWLNRLEI